MVQVITVNIHKSDVADAFWERLHAEPTAQEIAELPRRQRAGNLSERVMLVRAEAMTREIYTGASPMDGCWSLKHFGQTKDRIMSVLTRLAGITTDCLYAVSGNKGMTFHVAWGGNNAGRDVERAAYPKVPLLRGTKMQDRAIAESEGCPCLSHEATEVCYATSGIQVRHTVATTKHQADPLCEITREPSVELQRLARYLEADARIL